MSIIDFTASDVSLVSGISVLSEASEQTQQEKRNKSLSSLKPPKIITSAKDHNKRPIAPNGKSKTFNSNAFKITRPKNLKTQSVTTQTSGSSIKSPTRSSYKYPEHQKSVSPHGSRSSARHPETRRNVASVAGRSAPKSSANHRSAILNTISSIYKHPLHERKSNVISDKKLNNPRTESLRKLDKQKSKSSARSMEQHVNRVLHANGSSFKFTGNQNSATLRETRPTVKNPKYQESIRGLESKHSNRNPQHRNRSLVRTVACPKPDAVHASKHSVKNTKKPDSVTSPAYISSAKYLNYQISVIPHGKKPQEIGRSGIRLPSRSSLRFPGNVRTLIPKKSINQRSGILLATPSMTDSEYQRHGIVLPSGSSIKRPENQRVISQNLSVYTASNPEKHRYATPHAGERSGENTEEQKSVKPHESRSADRTEEEYEVNQKPLNVLPNDSRLSRFAPVPDILAVYQHQSSSPSHQMPGIQQFAESVMEAVHEADSETKSVCSNSTSSSQHEQSTKRTTKKSSRTTTKKKVQKFKSAGKRGARATKSLPVTTVKYQLQTKKKIFSRMAVPPQHCEISFESAVKKTGKPKFNRKFRKNVTDKKSKEVLKKLTDLHKNLNELASNITLGRSDSGVFAKKITHDLQKSIKENNVMNLKEEIYEEENNEPKLETNSNATALGLVHNGESHKMNTDPAPPAISKSQSTIFIPKSTESRKTPNVDKVPLAPSSSLNLKNEHQPQKLKPDYVLGKRINRNRVKSMRNMLLKFITEGPLTTCYTKMLKTSDSGSFYAYAPRAPSRIKKLS